MNINLCRLLASVALSFFIAGNCLADANHQPDELVAPYLVMKSKSVLSQIESLKITEKVDWKKASRVSISVEDNVYEPADLDLKIDHPYIISMKNMGSKAHDVAGEEFFSSVVVREVRTAGVRMSAFHVESLHLLPKGELELWLVPIKKGEFPFVCTLPGHFEDGMEGGFSISQ